MIPTYAELIGATAPSGIDGISMVPTLLGKGKQQQHEYLYWEFHEVGGKRAVRMGKWKAVQKNVDKSDDSPIQLFDINNDLGEKNDLAAKYPEIISTVKKIFKDEHTVSTDFPFRWERRGDAGTSKGKIAKKKKRKKGKKNKKS